MIQCISTEDNFRDAFYRRAIGIASYRIVSKDRRIEGEAFVLGIDILTAVLEPCEILFSSNGGKYTIVLSLSNHDFVTAVDIVCEYLDTKTRNSLSEIFRKRAQVAYIV